MPPGGRDCWLPHDSGAGLCWQHVGGVGSTTTIIIIIIIMVIFKCYKKKKKIQNINNKKTTIATWNVRTMNDDGKQDQLLNEMTRFKIDILGASETHWTTDT